MNYLCFLDFDGVTHPVTSNGRHFQADNIIPLTRYLLGLSKDLQVVISSTWRLDMELEEIKKNLGVLGNYVIGKTPEYYDPDITYERQAEVELYLNTK